MERYDVIVIGGGHAGIEAALSSARLGAKTALFTLSLDQIANMPCNPSIGGTAKGQLVREIDALGGEMGKAADATFLQSRILNRGKGPAVYSLRVQSDRRKYHDYMSLKLQQQENLTIRQEEITSVLCENKRVCGAVSKTGGEYKAKAVILCCGTYLGGKIHLGQVSYESGPDHVLPANILTRQLKDLGLPLRRFKTGTPPRVHRRSIDFSKLQVQHGDSEILPFSFETEGKLENKVVCHIAYTNENSHRILRENLHKSAMYSGKIEGVGPRYCPSIEDKIVRFADKERHQIFVEPMGMNTEEMYLQGLSTSMPLEVQQEFLESIPGFENIEILRPGYAIEYDCCDPRCLYPTLESKEIEGLYGAGQFNGSSGYEEAAAQGLIAGINAARKCGGLGPIILSRSSSYIGTLIDDLTIKGCEDPYRMMTSRSEYRLLLRQDNADSRLTPIGHEIGLISKERYEKFEEKQRQINEELGRVKKLVIKPDEGVNEYLVSRGTNPIKAPIHCDELLKRPQVEYKTFRALLSDQPPISDIVAEQVELLLKYEGYIKKQEKKAQQLQKMEQKTLSADIPYDKIEGIRLEAQEKLLKHKPGNIAQASQISGVNPSDISVLLIWLEKQND